MSKHQQPSQHLPTYGQEPPGLVSSARYADLLGKYRALKNAYLEQQRELAALRVHLPSTIEKVDE